MMIDHGLDKLIRHRKAELAVNRCKFKQVMLYKAPIEALLLSFFRLFVALRSLAACSFKNSEHTVIYTSPLLHASIISAKKRTVGQLCLPIIVWINEPRPS